MNEMDLHELQLVATCSAANKGQACHREVTWDVKGFKNISIRSKNLSALHRTETRLAVRRRPRSPLRRHSLILRLIHYSQGWWNSRGGGEERED